MDLPDFLTRTKYDDIRLTGRRIGLYHVVENFNNGMTPEMIASEYDPLPLAAVYKVIGFYLDNKAEVDAYCRTYREESDRQEAAAPPSNMAELRARTEAMRRAEPRPGA